MAERSVSEILRRRVAPIALVVALVALGTRTCASEMARADVHLFLGEAHAQLRSLRVDVLRAGESARVAYFERHYRERDAGREVSFDVRLDPGSYDLRIDVQLEDGGRVSARRLLRTIYVQDQARVTLDLSAELAAAPPRAPTGLKP